MPKFLEYLEDHGIIIEHGKVRVSDTHTFTNAKELFELAITDILEKNSEFYRDAIENGIEISITAKGPKDSKHEFSFQKQLDYYLGDME